MVSSSNNNSLAVRQWRIKSGCLIPNKESTWTRLVILTLRERRLTKRQAVMMRLVITKRWCLKAAVIRKSSMNSNLQTDRAVRVNVARNRSLSPSSNKIKQNKRFPASFQILSIHRNCAVCRGRPVGIVTILCLEKHKLEKRKESSIRNLTQWTQTLSKSTAFTFALSQTRKDSTSRCA